MQRLIVLVVSVLVIGGCKFYGSALPPEHPMSMDNAMEVARNQGSAPGGGTRAVVRKPVAPQVNQPSYIPEKELAVVSPPKTLLVWSYPHVTDDNTRVFGNWSTIFLSDRYEWVRPANELPAEEVTIQGMPYGFAR